MYNIKNDRMFTVKSNRVIVSLNNGDSLKNNKLISVLAIK